MIETTAQRVGPTIPKPNRVMKDDELSRRDFIKIAGAGAGGGILLAGCSVAPRGWRFFTEAEALVVEAIAEQIIPADDFPGAREANVINYIDRQLDSVFRKHQDTYRSGVEGVQQTSRLMAGGPFESLPWDRQTDVLRALESGDAEGSVWEALSSRMFFNLVRDHTMQGFYGSPRHGGNRRFASFRMLELDYPRIYGQNRYRIFPGK